MFSKHWSPPTLKRVLTLNSVTTHIHLLPLTSQDSPMLFTWHLSPSCLLMLSCCVDLFMDLGRILQFAACISVASAVGFFFCCCSCLYLLLHVVTHNIHFAKNFSNHTFAGGICRSSAFFQTSPIWSYLTQIRVRWARTAWKVNRKVELRQYCQIQGAWLGSTLDTVAIDLSQLNSILFHPSFESLGQFTVSPKVHSSW